MADHMLSWFLLGAKGYQAKESSDSWTLRGAGIPWRVQIQVAVMGRTSLSPLLNNTTLTTLLGTGGRLHGPS